MTKRRDLLVLAGLAALPLGAFRLWEARQGGGDAFDFADLPGVPGFRRIEAGASTSPGDPLAALTVPGTTPAHPRPLPASDLCGTLFAGEPPPPGIVPVASFSDYFCPYCRDLTARLAARATGGSIRVSWHELPILGSASEAAARAALAADAQGLYPEFQARLLRSAFLPEPGYLRELARSFGADPERLLADMRSPAISRRLDLSARAAAHLGIGATPALVVGRTLVSGAIPEARLNALIALEAEAGPLPC